MLIVVPPCSFYATQLQTFTSSTIILKHRVDQRKKKITDFGILKMACKSCASDNQVSIESCKSRTSYRRKFIFKMLRSRHIVKHGVVNNEINLEACVNWWVSVLLFWLKWRLEMMKSYASLLDLPKWLSPLMNLKIDLKSFLFLKSRLFKRRRTKSKCSECMGLEWCLFHF